MTAKYPAKPIYVVYGDDAFLRSDAVRQIRNQVLATEDAEFALTRFEGDHTTFKEVFQELHTIAMFGGNQRVVCIDEADSFVSKYRDELEKYVVNPSEQAVLVLQLKTFASNTNLYKKAAEKGHFVEAKTHTERTMPRWIVQWAQERYKLPCELAAAELIVQRIGLEHGLIDQEISKLSLLTEGKKGITLSLVEQSVGAWRSRTAFEMLDLALEGKTAAALGQLNALFTAGENANGILARIAPTLRKLAIATELYLEAERQNARISVRSALEKAGIKHFVLDKTEKQFIQLGRRRGINLSQWLLQLDLDLKGNSRTDPQLLLEMFIVNLSAAPLRDKRKES